MSYRRKSSSSTRPTLPSIRDLFPDELANTSGVPVRDNNDDYRRPRSPSQYMPSSRLHFKAPPRSSSSNSRDIPRVYSPTPDYYDASMSSSRNYSTIASSMYQPSSRASTVDHSVHYPTEERHSYAPQHSAISSTPTYDRPNSRTMTYEWKTRKTPQQDLYDTSSGKRPPAQAPWTISTTMDRPQQSDDEQTPVARHRNEIPVFQYPEHSPAPPQNEVGASTSKYDCSHCGKGFSRPSSLKIHLNSHTGEKPFQCPVEGCGRSFSVLSNMRRHARVHTPSSDDGSSGERYSSSSSSRSSLVDVMSIRSINNRRGSNASVSSTSSRRSHDSR